MSGYVDYLDIADKALAAKAARDQSDISDQSRLQTEGERTDLRALARSVSWQSSGYDINDINDKTSAHQSSSGYDINDINDKTSGFGRISRFGRTLRELERRCPDQVAVSDWQQAVEDAHKFLGQWGEQAEALGWTARDLFGLFQVPERPPASFRRLSRFDQTGLCWLLHGRPVVAMTADVAVMRCASGGSATLTYRKEVALSL